GRVILAARHRARTVPRAGAGGPAGGDGGAGCLPVPAARTGRERAGEHVGGPCVRDRGGLPSGVKKRREILLGGCGALRLSPMLPGSIGKSIRGASEVSGLQGDHFGKATTRRAARGFLRLREGSGRARERVLDLCAREASFLSKRGRSAMSKKRINTAKASAG